MVIRFFRDGETEPFRLDTVADLGEAKRIIEAFDDETDETESAETLIDVIDDEGKRWNPIGMPTTGIAFASDDVAAGLDRLMDELGVTPSKDELEKGYRFP